MTSSHPRDEVLSAIKSGRVTMRPRSYFMFMGGIFVLCVLTLALIFLYFVALAISAIDLASIWFAAQFGSSGFTAFIWSVPWIVILVIAVALLIIQALILRFPLIYQIPIAVSLIGILCVGITGALILRVVEAAFVERPIPLVVDPFVHRTLLAPGSVVERGSVSAVSESGFTLVRNGTETPIRVDENTRIEFGLSVSVGDNVLVFGVPEEHYIRALGIKRVK